MISRSFVLIGVLLVISPALADAVPSLAAPGVDQLTSAPASPDRPTEPQSQNDVAQRAREHFERGVALYEAGDLNGTLAEFERAYSLRESPLLASYIARVSFELRKFARSYRAFERFLAYPPTPGFEREREDAVQKLAQLRTQVAFVAITTSVPLARISIDDEPWGQTPLSEPVVLDAGVHRIRASKEHHAAVAKTITVSGGDQVTVELELEPLVGPEVSPSVSVIPMEVPEATRETPVLTPLAKGAFAASAALGVAGAVTGFFAFNASSELDERRFSESDGRKDFDARSERVHRLALTSDVLAATALTTAGVTLGFVIKRARGGHRTETSLGLSPSGARLTLRVP